jgi:hypothetical protein
MDEKTFRTKINEFVKEGKEIWVHTDNDEYLITGYSIVRGRVYLYRGNEFVDSFMLWDIKSIEGE